MGAIFDLEVYGLVLRFGAIFDRKKSSGSLNRSAFSVIDCKNRDYLGDEADEKALFVIPYKRY